MAHQSVERLPLIGVVAQDIAFRRLLRHTMLHALRLRREAETTGEPLPPESERMVEAVLSVRHLMPDMRTSKPNLRIEIERYIRQTGATATAAARRFGVARGTIVGWGFDPTGPQGASPYGYRIDALLGIEVPDADEQETLTRLLAMVAAGRGWSSIAAELNASGVPTRKGNPWHPTTVRRIAHRHGLTLAPTQIRTSYSNRRRYDTAFIESVVTWAHCNGVGFRRAANHFSLHYNTVRRWLRAAAKERA